MLFSKATEYAIRALAYMAERPDGTVCGLREIADHEHIPPVFLRKVLGDLRRHRILVSAKGIHGGYRFAKSPEKITLWDVVNILEPDAEWDQCLFGNGRCGLGRTCPLHEDWRKLRSDLIDFLRNKTISQTATSICVCEASPDSGQCPP